MRFNDALTNARVGTKPAFVEVGYGQVEPNHLSAQRTGQIYAQLPADENITVLEQGQFVKYDYATGKVNFTGKGEWMLVFNEIKLYREGQRDCEFAMIKDNYNARIYSPYGEDKAGGQSRYYNGKDAENNTGITLYKATADTAMDANKTYYEFANGAYVETEDDAFAEGKKYFEEYKTYAYDKVTTNPDLDIYEMFGTNDPFHIVPGYKEKRMPVGTKMVPRVFKTNVGDIYTTNTIAWDEQDGANPLTVGTSLYVGDKGILTGTKKTSATADGAVSGDMEWQVVKVYTMPDGQKGVKIMRIA